jgi:hypothetical protein
MTSRELQADFLLEEVMRWIARAEDDTETVLAGLAADWPEARALSLIRAFLVADEALSAVFRASVLGRDEAELARRLARDMAIRADRAEAQLPPGKAPLRLGAFLT